MKQMTLDEKKAFVRARMMRYAEYKRIAEAWQAEAEPTMSKRDTNGIRGSNVSDQTGNTAVRLVDQPEYVVEACTWVEVVNDALADLLLEDSIKGRGEVGKALAMEIFFGLSEECNKKYWYSERMEAICDVCMIAESTANAWIRSAVDAVVFQAASRNLI